MRPPLRRLAVLLSHLRLDPPPRVATPNSDHPPPRAAAAANVSTSPCASGGGETVEGAAPDGGGAGCCVFCRIVRDESPAFKLYEDDVCLCILDSHPLSFGHSLIIPKCHFPSLQATPPPVVAAICSKVPFLSNAIMKVTRCVPAVHKLAAFFRINFADHYIIYESFNLVVNNGAAAGQVIFHTHFHIIPRRDGDKLWPAESFIRHSIERNQETLDLVSGIKEQLLCSPSEDCKTEGSLMPKEL